MGINTSRDNREHGGRICIFCEEIVPKFTGTLAVNREVGYGLVGKAHDDCIAKSILREKRRRRYAAKRLKS